MSNTVNGTVVNLFELPRFVYTYLSQGEFWHPNGKPRIRVADMDDRWRQNAANWLLRRAPTWEFRYSVGEMDYLSSGCGGVFREFVGGDENGNAVVGAPVSMMPSGDMVCDAFEREQEDRAADPVSWMQTTALYLALTAPAS